MASVSIYSSHIELHKKQNISVPKTRQTMLLAWLPFTSSDVCARLYVLGTIYLVHCVRREGHS